MSSKGLEFDAGGDFGAVDPMAAVQAAMEPSPAPEPSAPVEGGSDTQPDSEVGTEKASWEDKDPNAEESEISSNPEPSTDDGPYVEVKGADGKVRKVALDPENEELKRILGKGTAADKWRIERDTSRREAQQLRAEIEAMRAEVEKARKVDNLEELKSLGHHTAAAREALGDEGFASFVEEVREALEVELHGDPDRINEYEKKVSARERELQDHQRTKREQELERRLEEIEERGHLSRYRAAATAALQKHDFSQYVEDPHIAEDLNKKVWKLAAGELKEYAARKGISPDQVTEQMIHKAIAQNAKVLRGGRVKIAEQRTDSIIEQKKQEAKENAQIIATERYPQGQQAVREDAIREWMNSGSTRSKDLLRAIVRKGK